MYNVMQYFISYVECFCGYTTFFISGIIMHACQKPMKKTMRYLVVFHGLLYMYTKAAKTFGKMKVSKLTGELSHEV